MVCLDATRAGSGGCRANDHKRLPDVGSRVLIGRDEATVRYVGVVHGQTGLWVGVEWDDPTRGKHDGSTGGIKYFNCVSGPSSGSFIRLEKVNSGVSVVQALLSRYTNEIGEGGAISGVDGGRAYVLTSSQRKLFVHLVGEERVTAHQSRTELLHRARLVDAGVAFVGPSEQLRQLAPNLVELDLSRNLISSWVLVAELCAALPRLASLNLSCNRLQLPRSPAGAAAVQQLTGLQVLVLNATGVGWPQVCSLQAQMPQLRELHLCSNGINSLDPDSEGGAGAVPTTSSSGSGSSSTQLTPVLGFPQLEVLDLEDNGISDWQQAMRLAYLPQLKRLCLGSNPIPCITYPASDVGASAESPSSGADGGTGAPSEAAGAAVTRGSAVGSMDASIQPFAHLQALLLGSCCLSSWSDVDALGRLPALVELRLSSNPLVEGGQRSCRFEVVARIAGLTLLNGAAVGPRERRDCELRYLHEAAAAAAATSGGAGGAGGSAAASGVCAHPRLAQLQVKYGHVSTAPAQPQCGGRALSSHVVEVVLCHGGRESKKKLPRSTTVAALKLLCQRLFKVKADRQVLLLHPSPEERPQSGQQQQLEAGQQQQDADKAGEDVSSDDTKGLDFFGIQSGCTIEVLDAGDAAARRQQDAQAHAAAAAAHESRIAAQERGLQRLFLAAER